MMLITANSLVFTQLSNDELKELNNRARAASEASGDGFLKRMSVGLNASMNTGSLFEGQSINEVMMRFPNSVKVEESRVRELRIRDLGDDVNYELRIRASGYDEKYRFSTYDKRDHQALKAMLGGRYKSSTWFL